jgi:SAM-dependent methyltransferase
VETKQASTVTDSKSTLSKLDVQRVKDRYLSRISKYGVTFESMNSGSVEKQRVRHTVHAEAIRRSTCRVLDVGCGLGDFYRFLTAKGFDCDYTGYDILPDYVNACREAFPEATFAVRNIFEDGIDSQFDTIVMSQVLNNRYENSDNLAVMQDAIRLAFAHARVSVSIDMFSTYVDYQNPDMFYYQPEEMFAFAKSLTRRVRLCHDYRSFEFAIQLFQIDADGFLL